MKRNKSVIGIDIGDNFLKAVELVYKKKNVYVSEVVHFPVPKGSVANGILLNPDVFKVKVGQILEAYSFYGENIVLGVPGEQAVIKTFEVPTNIPCKKKVIFEYIKDDIQSELSTPIDDLYLDFQVVGRKNTENGEQFEILLSAIKKDILNPYIEVFQSLGLNIIAADAELLAEARTLYLFSNDEEDDRTYVLLNISSKTTTLSFFEKKTLTYTRLIDMGASMFVKPVSEFKQINEREAEYILNQRNILEEEENIELRNIIANSMKSLVKEIHRIIAYYQSNIAHSHRKFTGILSGGGALLKGFDTFISEQLGFPITRNRALSFLEPVNPDKLNAEILFEISPLVSTAFGLALWEYVDILDLSKGV